MAAERFKISDTNPNDAIGGGGCVCGDNKVEGCVGPYAVFFATETDSMLSPHVVLSLKCAESFVRKAKTEVPLRAGEAKPRVAADDDDLVSI